MKGIFFALLLLLHLQAGAQIRFASFTSQPQPARLSAVDAQVQADPFLATTTLTLSFYNPGKDTIEARYAFRLSEDMAVTGFQLELNGAFRDGTIEERWKARNAYQQVTGQRIDPALLEMTWDHNYSLRIFPVAPKDTRRVRLVIRQLLRCSNGFVDYRFPLEYAGTVDRFATAAQVRNTPEQPTSAGGYWSDRVFNKEEATYMLRKTESGSVSLSTLAFRMRVDRPVFSCSWKDEGKELLFAHLPFTKEQVPDYIFLGFRLRSGAWLYDYESSGERYTLLLPVSEPDTVEAVYGNEKDQFALRSWPVAPAAGCESSVHLSALSQFGQIVRYNWDEQLRFGVKHGIVTPQTAYIVLERIEDYKRYGIRPPRELEAACAEQGYVWQDKTPALKAASQLELLQQAADEYSVRLQCTDAATPSLTVRSLKAPEVQPGLTNGVIASAQVPAVVAPSAPSSGGALNEVVVTALGLRRKPQELGYATSVVRPNELVGSNNVGAALSGKVSGLVVQNNAGSPDALPRLQLRGLRSMSGSNNPLIVINSNVVDQDAIRFLHPNDVESVNVIKPSSAAALYGSEAINGAIIITLKKNVRYYWSSTPRSYRLKDMPDEEYVVALREAGRTSMVGVYEELRAQPINHDAPLFYIEAAQEFRKAGLNTQAFATLYEAIHCAGAERSFTVRRSVAYVLEDWGLLNDAAREHRILLQRSYDLKTAYDLGLALYRAGKFQEAVDVCYEALCRTMGGSYSYGYSRQGWKGMILEELNDIIARHRDALDLSKIPADLIRPMKATLRIQASGSNNETWSRLEVKLPDSAGWTRPNVQGLRSRYNYYDYYYNQECSEYVSQAAPDGKYRVRLRDLYGSSSPQNPQMYRVVYRTEDASGMLQWTVRTMVLNNQYGEVEIDEWVKGRK